MHQSVKTIAVGEVTFLIVQAHAAATIEDRKRLSDAAAKVAKRYGITLADIPWDLENWLE